MIGPIYIDCKVYARRSLKCILAIFFRPACEGEPGVLIWNLKRISQHRETSRTGRSRAFACVLDPPICTERQDAYGKNIEHGEG